MGGSTKDLIYRIVSTSEGDGFKKTSKDADEAASSLDKAGRRADEVGGKKPSVSVKTDADEAGRKLRQAGQDAEGLGPSSAVAAGAVGMLTNKMVLLVAAGATLAPAMLAIPAALAGVAGVLATVGAAFGGVAAAVHDYGQESAAAGPSGASLAATAFSDAIAIRNAVQSIADARRQADQQAAASADSLTSAEERLAGAEQQAQTAEQNLTRARMDAARALESANEAAASSALDVQASQFALIDAQKQKQTTDQSITATAEDRAKADLAVQQAQESLIEVQNRAANAAADAATAQQQGIDQAPSVVAAQQAQQNAIQGVADAQRGLAAAQRQAADQQIASAESVQRAVQNLADTQRQQALAAAAAAASGSAAATRFAQDMAKLTPIAQAVAEKIISMKGGLDQLKATAQNSVLPGFMPVLQAASTLFPTINTGIALMGSTIGGLAAHLGAMMQSPVFRGELATIFAEGAKLVGAFGQGVLDLLPSLMKAVVAASPIVDALAAGFKSLLGTGLPAFFTGLATGAGGAGQAISAILDVVSHLLGPLGTLVGTLATALGPVFTALAPVVDQLVTVLAGALGPILTDLAPIVGDLAVALVQDLTPVIAALAPVVDLIIKEFAQMLPVLLPLVQLVAESLSMALRNLIPVITPLMPVFMRLATVLYQLLASILTPMLPVINTFGTTMAQLVPQMIPLINIAIDLVQALLPLIADSARWSATIMEYVIPAVGIVLGAFMRLATYVLGPLSTAVKGLINVFTEVAEGIAGAAKNAVGWVSDHWDHMIKTIEGLPGRLMKAGKGMWDWVGSELKTVINSGFIDNMNWVIRQINSLTHDLSDTWSWAGVPSIGTIDLIPHLAGGGTALTAGLALVGEKGPELVHLPAGATVNSNQNSQALLAGAGGGVHGQIEVIIRYPNGQEIDRQYVAWQRNGGVSEAIETGVRRVMAGR